MVKKIVASVVYIDVTLLTQTFVDGGIPPTLPSQSPTTNNAVLNARARFQVHLTINSIWQ